MMENLDHLKKGIAMILHLDSKCQLDEITREGGLNKGKIYVTFSAL